MSLSLLYSLLKYFSFSAVAIFCASLKIHKYFLIWGKITHAFQQSNTPQKQHTGRCPPSISPVVLFALIILNNESDAGAAKINVFKQPETIISAHPPVVIETAALENDNCRIIHRFKLKFS